MKTINIAISFLAMASIMASCSEELPLDEPRSEATASFSISVPSEVGTRADANPLDGVLTLEWTVFELTDNGSPRIFTSGTRPIESVSEEQTLELRLSTGMQYKITFCAYNNEHRSFAYYDNGKVKVNYAAADIIQIGDDLFTGCSSIFTANDEGHDETVVLRRPFAQLNWGASDLETPTVAPYLKGSTGSVTVESELFQTYDLFTEEMIDPVDGSFTFKEFDCSILSNETLGIPLFETKYRLLASNLLLIGKDKTTINCKMTFSGNVEAEAVVSGAPMAPNYRTNIYGGLISDPRSITLSLENSFDFDGSNNVNPFVKSL